MLALSRNDDLSIWDFALAFYQIPSVEVDCLVAQDQYGLDITALIFALYCARKGLGFDAGQAAELARTLSASVVEPLRKARIALKSTPSLVDQDAANLLRQSVKAAELEGERLTLNALAALPSKVPALPPELALRSIADASQASDGEALLALLKRLALSAQNM